jgi:glycosyltransferase involved in cell wall biosynthesis
MEYYKVPEDKISIISPAVDQKVFYPRESAEITKVKQNYGVKKPYILSLCTLEPRKNLVGVLDAYEKLPEKTKRSYILVLAGGKGWLDDELEKRIGELSAKYEVIKTGYVPDEDLPALYSGASVFVFPSFYEGFGMPPLEAMACGTPVITSDNTSLPEVVGNAGIMIKADDTERLAGEMERVLTNNKLAQNLREKGLEQAKKFSWEKSAKELLDVIEEVGRK